MCEKKKRYKREKRFGFQCDTLLNSKHRKHRHEKQTNRKTKKERKKEIVTFLFLQVFPPRQTVFCCKQVLRTREGSDWRSRGDGRLEGEVRFRVEADGRLVGGAGAACDRRFAHNNVSLCFGSSRSGTDDKTGY